MSDENKVSKKERGESRKLGKNSTLALTLAFNALTKDLKTESPRVTHTAFNGAIYEVTAVRKGNVFQVSAVPLVQ